MADVRRFPAEAIMMGVSKYAGSHAIRQLDKRVGARLFNRTIRSVVLTEARELFYRRVSPLVLELKSAFSDLVQVAAKP